MITVGVLSVSLVAVFGTVVYFLKKAPRQTELKGEVFIVTKGAQNFKLGLVEVIAIPEDKIESFVESKLTSINLEFSKFESVKQATLKDVEAAQQSYDEAKAVLDSLTRKYNEAKSAADAAATDMFALNEVDADDATYLRYVKRADNAKRVAEKLELQVEASRKEVAARELTLSGARVATSRAFDKVKELLSNEALLKGLPSEGTKAITNSEGQFSMKLDAARRYAIAAKAQRRVFDSTEEYYWLVWISPNDEDTNRVMLTNKNLLGEDSPDSVFKLKDLIPTGITQH